MKLTPRDKEVLEFIKGYMKENGMTPTMREIGAAMKIYSLKTVNTHFSRLSDLGYVKKNKNRYAVKGMKYVEEVE